MVQVQEGQPTPGLARVGEVAAELGVSASTVRAWERRFGIAPGRRSPGGHRRYTAEDIDQLRALRDLVRPDRASVVALGAADTDLLLLATRATLHARRVEDVRDVLVAYVQAVGGTTAGADDAGPGAIPVDLAFGSGPPVVACAEPGTVTRLQLEATLPILTEDARRVVALLRSGVGGTALAHDG